MLKLCKKGHSEIAYAVEECPVCTSEKKYLHDSDTCMSHLEEQKDKLRCEKDKLFMEVCQLKSQRDILLKRLKEVQSAKGV